MDTAVAYPEFLVDQVAVKVVDDVGVLVITHHDDLVNDQLLLRLLRQVHLLDGHLTASCHLDGNVHCPTSTIHTCNYADLYDNDNNNNNKN